MVYARVLDTLAYQGRTVAWLARQLLRDPAMVTRLLSGRPASNGSYYRMTLDLRAAISRALDVPESVLFEERGSDGNDC